MELLHHADNDQGVEEKNLRPLLGDHLSDVQEFPLLNEHLQNYSEAYLLKMFPINDASELIPQHTFGTGKPSSHFFVLHSLFPDDGFIKEYRIKKCTFIGMTVLFRHIL